VKLSPRWQAGVVKGLHVEKRLLAVGFLTADETVCAWNEEVSFDMVHALPAEQLNDKRKASSQIEGMLLTKA